jgi:O-succinylbenzoate synthase
VVVSSALETSIGLAAGVALAAALPHLPYACGLATTALLQRDLVEGGFVAVDGELAVCRPEPSFALMRRASGVEVQHRWADRLKAVRALR